MKLMSRGALETLELTLVHTGYEHLGFASRWTDCVNINFEFHSVIKCGLRKVAALSKVEISHHQSPQRCNAGVLDSSPTLIYTDIAPWYLALYGLCLAINPHALAHSRNDFAVLLFSPSNLNIAS
jgi:hypothetical protein